MPTDKEKAAEQADQEADDARKDYAAKEQDAADAHHDAEKEAQQRANDADDEE